MNCSASAQSRAKSTIERSAARGALFLVQMNVCWDARVCVALALPACAAAVRSLVVLTCRVAPWSPYRYFVFFCCLWIILNVWAWWGLIEWWGRNGKVREPLLRRTCARTAGLCHVNRGPTSCIPAYGHLSAAITGAYLLPAMIYTLTHGTICSAPCHLPRPLPLNSRDPRCFLSPCSRL